MYKLYINCLDIRLIKEREEKKTLKRNLISYTSLPTVQQGKIKSL